MYKKINSIPYTCGSTMFDALKPYCDKIVYKRYYCYPGDIFHQMYKGEEYIAIATNRRVERKIIYPLRFGRVMKLPQPHSELYRLNKEGG